MTLKQLEQALEVEKLREGANRGTDLCGRYPRCIFCDRMEKYPCATAHDTWLRAGKDGGEGLLEEPNFPMSEEASACTPAEEQVPAAEKVSAEEQVLAEEQVPAEVPAEQAPSEAQALSEEQAEPCEAAPAKEQEEETVKRPGSGYIARGKGDYALLRLVRRKQENN